MTTLARALIAVLLGILILFPGVELLRFAVTDLFRVYRDMTLTDCLLVFVVILLIALLLQPRGDSERKVRPRREEPDLTLVGNRPPGQSRRTQRTPHGQRRSREAPPPREE